MATINYLIFGPVALAIAYSAYTVIRMNAQSSGNEEMKRISRAIQTGSAAYLNRQYFTITLVAVPLALVIWYYLGQMTAMGFELTHVYGLTEVYGPAAVCAQQARWQTLEDGERARLTARQGVRYHLQRDVTVLNPETLVPVPADGVTIGEVAFRGNICMKGYLKNPRATEDAFRGGWFHTGDLAVLAPDGYVQIKDRSKDVIISGGENISSIEVEDALYRHPAVALVAVVAMPDAKWGEVPCAFVELKTGMQASADSLSAHCRDWLAGYKIPRTFRFCELPKTSTGKIQKFELRKLAGSVNAIDLASAGDLATN